MPSVALTVAQTQLPDLIARLIPGEELRILQGSQVVAKLTRECPLPSKPRQPGSCKGLITILSEDDEHLVDFAEYMP